MTSKINDYSLLEITNYQTRTSIMKSSTPWDLSHDVDPISMLIGLDASVYAKRIQTGDIIVDNMPESSAYVHQHPHLLQSPISAINYCIVEHALARISGKPL